jgi:Protein of unknown function (DUF1549)/Protein of unknown function (DUF1553)/Bacterial Ig-like domain (group 2)
VFRIIAIVCLASFFAPRATAESLHFENDIAPLLARHNCNSSGCHGKAEGQGGFKLSVFGFDPAADYASIVKDGRGRRVNSTAVDESLLLRKATGRSPHGGGTRLKSDSRDYRTLRDWIASGTPIGDPNAPRVNGIRVTPTETILLPGERSSIKVFAKRSDGRETDVTDHAKYQTNSEAVATVSADGTVTANDVPGEAAAMASYRGHVAVCSVLVPRPGPKVASAAPRFNAIDEHVDRKLAKLNIAPSDICDDATFFRRVHLDLIGLLPEPDAARTFLDSQEKDKRAKAVDSLLTRPEFAELMALRWADLLRVDRRSLGHQRAYAYHRWIRDSFARNRPFDEFARELVAAEGPIVDVPAANFFKVVTKPGEAASTISQVFLGVRIACAECHHHPTDRWTQTDYAGMQAFFAPLQSRGESILAKGEPIARHPRTGDTVFAHALGDSPPNEKPSGDRRSALASWMTDPANPYFARNYANRVWAFLFGHGIVEPVDDVRATNPPSNPELLVALAKFAVESNYDTKALIRFVCASRVYQSSSTPNASNEKDVRNFSRSLLRRPGAEVLLDMIGQATGVPDRFAGLPAGTRAVQVWDSETKQPFLRLFGRPMRATACECERNVEPSSTQVLHLLNSPDFQRRLSHPNGTVGILVRAEPDDRKLTESLYLAYYSRRPTAAETKRVVGFFQSKTDRRKAAEDLAWVLLNSLEFTFNH